MPRRNDGIFDLLMELPWWVSVIVAAIVYVSLRFVVPSIPFENPVLKGMAAVVPRLAWIAIVFLVPGAFSALQSVTKRSLLVRQSGIESIRELSWRQFEELLGEAYRRQGFTVLENTGSGPDGGVDLVIRQGGNEYLVQCKQWRARKVGVKVAREIFGIMHAQNATGVIIVTSGMFTQEAKNFAEDKPIDLVEGSQLVDLIQNVRKTPRALTSGQNLATATECPNCGSKLVVRVAKRGANPGSRFWACTSYPKCRYTRQYTG